MLLVCALVSIPQLNIEVSTGGTTILNLIASTDRTTCGRRLPACCYGANNKVEETHPSSQDCNPHIRATLKISTDV